MLGSETSTVPSRANPGQIPVFENLMPRVHRNCLVPCPCCGSGVFDHADPPSGIFLPFLFPHNPATAAGIQTSEFRMSLSEQCTPEPENPPAGRRARRRAAPEAEARGGGRAPRERRDVLNAEREGGVPTGVRIFRGSMKKVAVRSGFSALMSYPDSDWIKRD